MHDIPSALFHLLREHRKVRRMTQQDMCECLMINGAPSIYRSTYSMCETTRARHTVASDASFRQAAAIVLGLTPAALESRLLAYQMPNPCNYCRNVPPDETCYSCKRDRYERRI